MLNVEYKLAQIFELPNLLIGAFLDQIHVKKLIIILFFVTRVRKEMQENFIYTAKNLSQMRSMVF